MTHGKYKVLAITLNFDNVKPRTSHSGMELKRFHRITREIDFLFDANFNPIQ